MVAILIVFISYSEKFVNNLSFINFQVCNSKKALKLHILTIHTPDHLKPWRCSRCTKGFTEKGRLADHMNVHLGIKPHNCEQCGQSFSNDSNKRAHIKSVHMGLKRSK